LSLPRIGVSFVQFFHGTIGRKSEIALKGLVLKGVVARAWWQSGMGGMTGATDNQDEVLAFLGNATTHGGTAVKRIDTHAASVFLAGDRVLKMKRAVRFPFLDYSTLEKRKAACEAELAVNAPYAPEIYRGVTPITREADGRLAIAGSGTPVEWAVEMRRFDETRTLDHIPGAIDEALADALGRAVAAAHDKAPKVDAEPWIAALGSYIDEHAAAFAEHPEIFPAAANEALAAKSRAAYARIVPFLRERGRHGFVRRIHGDLHLGNIALIDGKPVLFDAIEFSAIIASGDVFYDLAFLLMDLLERGLPQAANIVLNRYLIAAQRDENFDALTTLPFFLALRAAIRAKVAVPRMARAAAPERAEIAREARAYFDFALRAIAPPQPRCVAVGGLSGTGKSRLARMLAADLLPMPGAVVVRSDVERKALFGVGETEKLPAESYRADATARVYATLADKARRTLAAGHSVIIDAVFARADERAAIAATARAAATPLEGLFLTADIATRIARVGGRARDASDADAKVARAQESYDLGSLDWANVDASGTPEQTLARAEAALRINRTPAPAS
jgi:aminoglycoside phosphotransferase family enzyme